MNRIKKFIEIINTKLSERKSVWLECNKTIVSNKLYMEGVYRDIKDFKKMLLGNRVLDYGAGGGYTSLLLSELDVTAVDLKNFKEGTSLYKNVTEDQIDIFKKINIPFVFFEDKLPFEDNSFDGILAYAVIEHISSDRLILDMLEIKRTLKPNGVIYISRLPQKLSPTEYISGILGYNHHDKLYSKKEIIYLLNFLDFEICDFYYEDMLPFYPMGITNFLYPLLSVVNKLLLFTPLKYFSHNFRIIARKKNGTY